MSNDDIQKVGNEESTDGQGEKKETVSGSDQQARQDGKSQPAADSRKTKRIVCALIPVVIGLLIAFASASKGSAVDSMTARSDDATVSEVDVSTRRDSDGERETNIRVAVTFEDSDHVEHTARSLYSPRREGMHHEGEKVSIMYDPRDPSGSCVIVGEEKLLELREEGNGMMWVVIGFCAGLLVYFFML